MQTWEYSLPHNGSELFIALEQKFINCRRPWFGFSCDSVPLICTVPRKNSGTLLCISLAPLLKEQICAEGLPEVLNILSLLALQHFGALGDGPLQRVHRSRSSVQSGHCALSFHRWLTSLHSSMLEAEHSEMLAAFKMHDFQPSANKSL